jgi:hypothetical protein
MHHRLLDEAVAVEAFPKEQAIIELGFCVGIR